MKYPPRSSSKLLVLLLHHDMLGLGVLVCMSNAPDGSPREGLCCGRAAPGSGSTGRKGCDCTKEVAVSAQNLNVGGGTPMCTSHHVRIMMFLAALASREEVLPHLEQITTPLSCLPFLVLMYETGCGIV